MSDTLESGSSAGAFRTTRWTQVLAARGESPEARSALSELCAAYYQPVFHFLQREGRTDDAARELTHEFFARVLGHQSLAGADPQRGRFRSYLLSAVKHFVADLRDREHTAKRGGGVEHESLHAGTDTSPGVDVPDTTTADVGFDREWAMTVLDRALKALAKEQASIGKTRDFEVLKPWLTGEAAAQPQAKAAHELGMTEGAVKVAIHRLRRRFRDLVKSEIAQTVGDPALVQEELQSLLAALG